MTTTDQELREEIAASRAGKKRWRCPMPLRKRIIRHASERKRQGLSLRQMAKALGLGESTLLRWFRVTDGRLRPVRVAESASENAELALVTPGGYRLEGLSAATAVEVLRGLGC